MPVQGVYTMGYTRVKQTKNCNFGLITVLIGLRTISIDISELEYQKFGLKTDRLSFSDFVDMVSRELSRQNLARTVEFAQQYGLSNMTMDGITEEVKAVRNKNAAHSCHQRTCFGKHSEKLSLLHS